MYESFNMHKIFDQMRLKQRSNDTQNPKHGRLNEKKLNSRNESNFNVHLHHIRVLDR